MTLHKRWMEKAFLKDGRANEAVWSEYLPKEQKVYENILKEKQTEISGKVSELAERFKMSAEEVSAFIDGLNEVIPEPYDMDEVTEDSDIKLYLDFEKLYKKMVEYKAEHLYTLPEWSNVFDEDTLKTYYTEQRRSRTVVKDKKIGRNDPCPCGSGKKYKKCCGA